MKAPSSRIRGLWEGRRRVRRRRGWRGKEKDGLLDVATSEVAAVLVACQLRRALVDFDLVGREIGSHTELPVDRDGIRKIISCFPSAQAPQSTPVENAPPNRLVERQDPRRPARPGKALQRLDIGPPPDLGFLQPHL